MSNPKNYTTAVVSIKFKFQFDFESIFNCIYSSQHQCLLHNSSTGWALLTTSLPCYLNVAQTLIWKEVSSSYNNNSLAFKIVPTVRTKALHVLYTARGRKVIYRAGHRGDVPCSILVVDVLRFVCPAAKQQYEQHSGCRASSWLTGECFDFSVLHKQSSHTHIVLLAWT